MPTIFLTIASWFGISPFRLIMYAVLGISILTGALALRQHYINKGWYAHAAKVQKQDNAAIDAAKKVEKKTEACSNTNGYWDVITQKCKLEDE